MISIALMGASGRMGSAINRYILQCDSIRINQAIVRRSNRYFEQLLDNTSVICRESLTPNSDVVVDFTGPEMTMANLKFCQEHHMAMVIGTTGLSEQDIIQIHKASADIAIVFAANTSVAVNLTYLLASLAAKVMPDADVEIIEAHHHHKKDAPSGTALAIGQHIVETKKQALDDVAVYSRHGNDCLRQQGDIGFSTIRGGDIAGEHTAMFIGEGERVEITQRAITRDTFAQGAVKAAEWVAQQKPGLYGMLDVLGLKSLEAFIKSKQ
jgi:4-hydroxy-tetrahydrodipicolinate reductase